MITAVEQEDHRPKMYVNLMQGPLDGQRFSVKKPTDEITLPLFIFKNTKMTNAFMDSKGTWYYTHKLPKSMKSSAPKAVGKAIYRYNHRIIEEKGTIVEKYYDYVRSEKIEK